MSKERDKYHMISLTGRIFLTDTNELFMKKKSTHRYKHRKQIYGDQKGRNKLGV